MCRSILAGILSLSLAAATHAQADNRFGALREYLLRRAAEAESRVTSAEAALAHAQQLLTQARTQGDAQAEQVMRESVATRERTLQTARNMRDRAKLELDDFNGGLARLSAHKFPILRRRGEITLAAPDGKRYFDGRELKVGDVVQTGANSYVRLMLPDGGLVDIGPYSSFTYLGSKKHFLEKGWLHEVIKCNLDRLQSSSGQIDPCVFRQFSSQVLVFGVRGTEYSAAVADSTTVRLTVWDGSIELRDKGGVTVGTAQNGETVAAHWSRGHWTVARDSAATRKWWMEFE